ncbi:glycosyltransferase family 4 protein [Brucepastera parasyntrophica]|uniref:glycosyltransferase family 4 protein n=1 Tax=Brucepastera parasyntrophica TaxID=2880008 RepID=UPI002108F566|nr:glycosyltransferase family 4 protein [Brucepastera parasyntrophica]ULQ60048.1 glycosyltransferase family 4 protein [Brucepastera parasyntrophica]
MKITGIFLNSQIRTGGHRRYIELMEGLAKRGNSVLLIANSSLDLHLKNMTILPLDYKHKKKLVPFSIQFMRLLKKHRQKIKEDGKGSDYIMVHGETHFPAGTYLKKILSAKLFYAVRSDAVTESETFLKSPAEPFRKKIKYFLDVIKYKKYEKMISHRADIIAFQSKIDYNNFRSRTGVDENKCCIIKGNIGEPWFRKENENINHSESLKKVLYIGAIGERKGIPYLIDAFRILHERNIPLHLELVGRESALALEMMQYINRNGFSGMVTFAGYSPDPFIYMKDADMLVVPSIFDSYPDVILEGLHAGIPVIASRVGGIPDILEDERLLFPPADSAYLADLLEKLYTSPEVYKKYRSLCAEYKEKFHFDWPEKWEDEMKKHLQKL